MDFVSNLFKKSKTKTVAPSIQPEQNNSPNKSVNLLDATTTTFENSILMPATEPENLNTLDVTSTNQENKRPPRFSILGTFDPIYQKKESADNEKSDSTDVDLRCLIDETTTKQPVSIVIDETLQRNNENQNLATSVVNDCVKKAADGIKLPVPENEFNKSYVSDVSSVSDVSEQNNTVILSKSYVIENKEDTSADNQNNNPDKSASDSVLSVNEETSIKLVPHLKVREATGVSELSDSFLDKFTRSTVISTPTSKDKTRFSQNVLDNTFAKKDSLEFGEKEELDAQDTDSIELENPISQSEDFDTDSLNEEIESAQNEILHELSVESNKIVCELNKTQEIFCETVAPEIIQEEIVVAETDLNVNKSFEIIEKLQPVKLEQKEQIIQEINVTYSEPISTNKQERQEEVSIEKDKPQLEDFEEKEPVVQEIKVVEPQSSTPDLDQIDEVVESPSKNTTLQIFVQEDSTVKADNQSVVLEEKELILEEGEPISSDKVEHQVEISNEIVDKITPVKAVGNKIPYDISSTPNTNIAHDLDSAVNKNISFVIDSSPIAKLKPESPEKLSEIIKKQESFVEIKNNSDITSSPNIKAVDSVEATPLNKNLSFVVEASPLVEEKPQSPQKVCEVPSEVSTSPASKSIHEVDSTEAKQTKNLSFVVESSPLVEAKSESPQKLCEISPISSPVNKSTQEVDPLKAKPVNKNLSFVIESPSSVKVKPESPQKLCEITPVSSPANKSTHEVDPIEAERVNKNLSFTIESSPLVKANQESPQKLIEFSSEIISSLANKSTHEVDPTVEEPVNKNISFVIGSPIAKVQPESPKKIEEDIGFKPLEQISKVSSDEIVVKTPQKVETKTEAIEDILDILEAPIAAPVISESSEIKDRHMSEAKPIEKSEVSESAVTNPAPTNEMGEVINQKDCFQKQSDITNGGVDNKESLDPKNEMYNEMVERLSLLESECEKYKVQVADLKREIKSCRQKSVSLESEVADLKRKENELNILLDEYKNKKSESTDTDGKDEELKLLRASEETLKNEVIELKVLVKQHENKLKELQQKEVKLADDLSSKTQSELQISRVMEEYEKSISSLVAENEKMKKERDTAQMHLSNIELAFSDVHQKYERCKRVVQGYKDNEESYRQDIAVNRETIATQEQKYATLKAHAMAQLEKSNQELLGIKKQHETEMARLTAQLKRYEIKNDSLMEALQQKTKECEQLSAVCDEFIGNV